MTFLQYVAKDLLAKHDAQSLADVAVVFPNKRASLFLNEALYEENGKPLWSPAYFTISDLFRHHSPLTVPDQITLIFRLYNVYVNVTGSGEPLDHFYSWGQLMLADFDDLDKNLVDADKLFINLEAWQSMKDFSFLTDTQRKSLEEFFGRMMDDTALQQRFNNIWKYLGTIYHAYEDDLRNNGLAYEGMLYRDVVERKVDDFKYGHYVFVGFNLLQKVEQRLFRLLKESGKAEFYWDYDVAYMQPQYEAGRFIKQYIDKFPNELSPSRISSGIDADEIYDNLSKAKDITYISAPTEDIQARYVTTWLQQCLPADDQTSHDLYTGGPSAKFKAQCSKLKAGDIAIVLGDESLLQNVIHCLPEGVDNVNITTGYPLSASPVSTLAYALLNLRLKGLTADGKYYRLKYVNQVLRHPYAKYLSDDCQSLLQTLNEAKTYYPSLAQLTMERDEAVQLLFQPLEATDGQLPVLPWMGSVMKRVGIGAREVDDPLLHESVFRMYTLINRLNDIMVVTQTDLSGIRDGKQLVSVTILQRLLNQLVASTTIPLHGEPAMGIQIMGVLETRNLDFKHVLVLSANEGNLPKGVDDASFIPHSLRRGYEMTTIENKVAIYAYYFHSLLQRASDVALTYNNATDDGHQGEMSRFMLQFLVENGGRQTIHRRTLQSGQEVEPVNRTPVEKKGEVAEALRSLTSLSPTAISRYLRCNLQFYYYSLCGLREQDDTEEDEIDNATFGNIFHRTAELIYQHLSGEGHRHVITEDDIKNFLKDKRLLDDMLDQAFREKLFKVENPNFHPRYNGLQLLNRKVLRLYMLRLLKLDARHTPFAILALEETFSDNVTFEVNGTARNLTLGGQIDRLDRITAGGQPLIRVIDYKTGTPQTSLPADVSDVFNPQYVDSRHTIYYLQACLYASLIRKGEHTQPKINAANEPVAPALLFIRQASGDDYNPIIKLKGKAGKKVMINDIGEIYEEYMDGLKALLSEIFDEQKPFMPTEDAKRCLNCPYKDICAI